MWQAYLLLGHAYQVRGKNHATGGTGPVFHIESGIKLREIGIAAIAKYAFYKVQVADQVAGCKKMHFHGFLGFLTGYLRTYSRPQ